MADSGYYVGDKATGTPLESLGGGGGGVTATQLASNGVIQNQEVVITHPADVDGKRIVQVTEFAIGGGQTNTDLDFDLADEGQFTQEDATVGTDFIGGKVTLHGTITGGNVVAFDPTRKGSLLTLSNANTTVNTSTTAWQSVLSDTPISDNHYVEFTLTATIAPHHFMLGVAEQSLNVESYSGASIDGWPYYTFSGALHYGNSPTAYGDPLVQGDVLGMAFKNGNVYFSKNGVWQAGSDPVTETSPAFTGLGEVYVVASLYSADQTLDVNFGGSAFAYTVPSGYYGMDSQKTYTLTSYYISTTDTNKILLDSFQSLDTTTITSSEPTNTSIYGLVSFDGRATWEKWNGSSWDNLGALTLGTYDFSTGNTVAQIETGLSSLTITDETSLDFAFDLSSTDASVTPSIDQITLNYTEDGVYKQTTPAVDYESSYTSDTTTTIKKLTTGTNNIKINVIQ